MDPSHGPLPDFLSCSDSDLKLIPVGGLPTAAGTQMSARRSYAVLDQLPLSMIRQARVTETRPLWMMPTDHALFATTAVVQDCVLEETDCSRRGPQQATFAADCCASGSSLAG